MNNLEMVAEFHEKHKIYMAYITGNPGKEESLFRIRLIAEEFAELIKAAQKQDVIEVADALADLLYVTYGMALAYGIHLDEVFKEVHKSNMTKDVGKKDSKKVLKGKSFVPPDINGVLFGTRHSDCNT